MTAGFCCSTLVNLEHRTVCIDSGYGSLYQSPVPVLRLRLGDRASCINKYRYQLDAANDLLVVNQFSTCFGCVYAHLQEFKLPYTAFGFQSCKMKCCVMEAYCVKLW
jgi:hypothetical protein